MSKRRFLGYRLRNIKADAEQLPYATLDDGCTGFDWAHGTPSPLNAVELLRLIVRMTEYQAKFSCCWHPSDLRIIRVYGRKKVSK